MGLLSEARAYRAGTGPACGVARVMELLPEPERSEFVEAIDDHTILASGLAKVLKAHGIDLKDQSIRRHRNGTCKCR